MKSLIFGMLLFVFGITNIQANTISAPAKTGQIEGNVNEAFTNIPMEYANIILYNSTDSVMQNGTITDTAGYFMLDKIPFGTYYLEIYFIGYEKQIIQNLVIDDNHRELQIPTVSLKRADAEIGEVNVIEERSQVEFQIDKKVLNVGQDLASAGGTAVDVLENAPSVQVDSEGNVTLRGSTDFKILINGKPSLIQGSDALKQIPASSIRQVEIITNPSAKYDPEGTSGIINIVLNEQSLDGINGILNASIGNGDKYSADFLINYRKGKINTFAGIVFQDNVYSQNINYVSDVNINNISEHIVSFGKMGGSMENSEIKAGFDYFINDNNSFSLSGSYAQQNYGRFSNMKTNTLALLQENTTYVIANDINNATGNNVVDITADYTTKFSDNKELVTTALFSLWDGLETQELKLLQTNQYWEMSDYLRNMRDRKGDYNYNFTLKSDYTQTLAEKYKIEAGYQFRYDNRIEDFTVENFDNDLGWVQDHNFDNNLHYTRYIYSAYSTFSGEISGFGYQLGLRGEYTDRNIDIEKSDKNYIYQKFDVFPTLHISRNMKANQQIMLSYSRRIRRPNSWVLNNYPKYIDEHNIFLGNPDVTPEFSNSYEFSYRKIFEKVSLSAQAYYRNTIDAFTEYRTLNEDGIVEHRLNNMDNRVSYGLELMTNIDITKWWSIMAAADLYHYKADGIISDVSVTKETNTVDARCISNFTLKWGTRIQFINYYGAPVADLEGDRDYLYVANIGVSQQFLDNKASVSLSIQDIFNTLDIDYTISDANYKTNFTIEPEQTVMLSFTYRINNFAERKNIQNDDEYSGGGLMN